MNTTISDLSKFAAALVRGDGLSAASRAEMTKPQLHITPSSGLPDIVAPDNSGGVMVPINKTK